MVYTRSTAKMGMGFLWGFVISQAFRDVYLSNLYGDLSLYEIAFLAFGSSAFVFGLILLIFKRRELGRLWQGRKTVLLLNVTTMISWLLYFQALNLVEPSAVNLAFNSVVPASIGILGLLGLKDGLVVTSQPERILHFALLAVVIFMGAAIALGYSGVGSDEALWAGLGVALAAISGFSISAEMIFAKRMNLKGVSPVAIVGVRFLLVSVFCRIMLLQEPSAYTGQTTEALISQAIIFLVILIAPIYLVQAGIAKTTPLVSGIICSLGPIATLGLQTVSGSNTLSNFMLAVVGVYTMLAIACALISGSPQRRSGRWIPKTA